MNTNRHHGFRLPAEWEPQSSVMLIWPHEDTDWRPYLKEITEVYLQMADAITRHEPCSSRHETQNRCAPYWQKD